MGKAFLGSYGRIVGYIFLGMALLCLDFFSKAYVYTILPGIQSGSIPIFHFMGIDFSISLAVNKGAAWGIFADFQTLLMVIRIIVILGMLAYLIFFNSHKKTTAALVLIVAGALGNVIDFFLYGFVIDFLHFNLWGYHFPIFNFADTCITIGVMWLFLIGIFKRKTKLYV